MPFPWHAAAAGVDRLRGGQEVLLEGHMHAFTVLGGVPIGPVRYDNLRLAVAQVVGFSRQRVETVRWCRRAWARRTGISLPPDTIDDSGISSRAG
jgi:hypothetical protein